jgi:hypothetical protein
LVLSPSFVLGPSLVLGNECLANLVGQLVKSWTRVFVVHSETRIDLAALYEGIDKPPNQVGHCAEEAPSCD